jgi:phospholipid/cholesterol/gamma-HCH transport system substrate-binding protein
MRRLATGALLTLALVGAAIVTVGASDGGGNSYKVRAIFDDVASAVPGEDLKIAGARVGKIESMDVTRGNKAAVTLDVTDSDFTPFHRDARCTIRPQSLIGEKYVECDPGTLRSPELRTIPDGLPGEGDHFLPLANTSAPVDIDLINNIMRLPFRQRFSILLSELGAGFAGRGEDLNAVIRRANPALRETDQVLKQLADENTTLARLAEQSDQSLAPLARERRHLAGFITHANEVGEATAAERANIEKGIQKLPEFLRQLKPYLTDLGQLADDMTPTLTDLNQAAPALARMTLALGPFSQGATKSLVSLGKATDVGGPVLQKANPVVNDLKAFAGNAVPVSKNLDSLTASLDKTGGLEQFMNYIFFQMTAINGFDEISHYLRASLLVNVCSTYVSTAAPGCGANFTQRKSISSSNSASVAAAAKASPAITALRKVAKGVLSLGARVPSDRQIQRQNRAGVRRIRAAAAKDSSPALDGAGGQDEALLSYLMGNG